MTTTKEKLPTLYQALKKMNACEKALEWSKSYGRNWEKAWNECPSYHWLNWLCVICIHISWKLVAKASYESFCAIYNPDAYRKVITFKHVMQAYRKLARKPKIN